MDQRQYGLCGAAVAGVAALQQEHENKLADHCCVRAAACTLSDGRADGCHDRIIVTTGCGKGYSRHSVLELWQAAWSRHGMHRIAALDYAEGRQSNVVEFLCMVGRLGRTWPSAIPLQPHRPC